MGIYFGIAIVVGLLLPFPISLLMLFVIIIPLSIFRRRKYFMGINIDRADNASFFSIIRRRLFGQKAIDFYCINCGKKHRKIACPRCGSKMKKASF